jgi:hypothetical protein
MSNALGLNALLVTRQLADLGPGPREGVESEASLNLKLRPLFEGSRLSAERQELIRALVLLWHDHLDSAHTIAQGIDTADGAFVHGIMHRREPDYGNAAYWFRRVGKHPAFGELALRTERLLGSTPQEDPKPQLIPQGQWNPRQFINLCEAAAGKAGSNATRLLLQQVQYLEFESLLDYLANDSSI